MESKGTFYGVAGSYTLKVPVIDFLKIVINPEARVAKGEVEYSSSDVKSLDMFGAIMFDLRPLLGAEFQFGKNHAIRSYTGYGYQSMIYDTQKEITGENYIGRKWIDYTYFKYIPIGVLYQADIAKDWKLKLTAEYDFLIENQTKSFLGTLKNGNKIVFKTVESTQKGHGIRGSIDISKDFSFGLIVVKPYFNLWKVKESENTDGLNYEPDKTIKEVGLSLSVIF